MSSQRVSVVEGLNLEEQNTIIALMSHSEEKSLLNLNVLSSPKWICTPLREFEFATMPV